MLTDQDIKKLTSSVIKEMEKHFITRSELDELTDEELENLNKGRVEMIKGNFYTTDEFRHWLLGGEDKKTRPKKRKARAPSRA